MTTLWRFIGMAGSDFRIGLLSPIPALAGICTGMNNYEKFRKLSLFRQCKKDIMLRIDFSLAILKET